jgi:lipid-binding SYLF domain-containing protein
LRICRARDFGGRFGTLDAFKFREGEEAVMNHENQKRILVVLLAVISIAVLMWTASPARSDDEHRGKAKEAASQSAKAAKVFDAIMQAPDKSIPRDLLAKAKAVAVFPHVIKASFVVGGEGGRGVVSRRTSTGWGDPVFFRAGGGSVGWQIGASATDFVLLIMNDDALEGLMKDKFELGAEAAVAGGPVGRVAGAGTDALLQAQVLSYSRSHGLFAGVSLKGVVIRPENDLNRAVYGKGARALLSEPETSAGGTNGGLPSFPNELSKYAVDPGTDR